MSAWTQALGTALVDFLWQGAIVGSLLWIALAALGNRSPSIRYVVSCAALAILTLLPAFTVVALWTWSMPSTGAAQPAAASFASGGAVSMPQTMLPIWLVSDSPRIAWLDQVQRWALPIWSAGVLLFSLRLVFGCWHAFAARRGQDCDDPVVLAMIGDLARRIGVSRRMRVVVARLEDGPAVIGWLRPAILMPPAVAMGLTPQQLEAVLAHELAHVRRHDYLVNLFQVVVETLFFYHPVVWWTSRQIRIERELCCDDIAVRACGDPVGYVRALTVLARQQLAVPALTMAATSGSLLHRVQRLLGAPPREFSPGRVSGLIAAVLAAACVVVNVDWLQASGGQEAVAEPLKFEVASIKVNRLNDRIVSDSGQGGRYTARGMSLAMLIRSAYAVQEFQIVNGPGWIDSDRFDILAKEPDTVPPRTPGAVGPTAQQLMLRALLEERFGLVVHKETRQLPVYALVPAKRDGSLGPQLRRSSTDCTGASGPASPGRSGGPWVQNPCGTSVGPGLILAGGRTMGQIATAFSTLTNTGFSLNRLVVDRTGLEGTFDMTLRFTPDNVTNFGPGGPPAGLPPVDPNGPSIFTAVQEQLGLKLESQRGPVEVLVIDRVQRPTED